MPFIGPGGSCDLVSCAPGYVPAPAPVPAVCNGTDSGSTWWGDATLSGDSSIALSQFALRINRVAYNQSVQGVVLNLTAANISVVQVRLTILPAVRLSFNDPPLTTAYSNVYGSSSSASGNVEFLFNASVLLVAGNDYYIQLTTGSTAAVNLTVKKSSLQVQYFRGVMDNEVIQADSLNYTWANVYPPFRIKLAAKLIDSTGQVVCLRMCEVTGQLDE